MLSWKKNDMYTFGKFCTVNCMLALWKVNLPHNTSGAHYYGYLDHV